MINLDQALAARTPTTKPASVILATVVRLSGDHVIVQEPSGSQLELPRLRSYTTPVEGDVVLVVKAGSGAWVAGAFGPQPDAGTAPPDILPPEPVPGSSTFLPTYTGTWRGGWRTDTTDLYQGDWTGRGRNTGVADYGGQPQGLAGATPTAARVTVRRGAGGANAATAPTLRLLGRLADGAPTILASTGCPALTIGQQADAPVPTEWVGALIHGAAGGIGIHVDASAPYVQLDGRDSFASSMALTIDWSRS